MSVSPNDYFRCKSCGLKSYCTTYLYCESCGYQEEKDRAFMVKHGRWTPKKKDSNRPQGVDEPKEE